MDESYKEKRLGFARQILTLRKERDSQVDTVMKLSIPDDLKEQCKAAIFWNFYNEMKNVSNLSWYQECRESHLPDTQGRIDLIKRKGLKLGLYWSYSKVLNDLKNYVDIGKYDKEMLGKIWRVVKIDFPAVWDFNWFNTAFFLSKDRITAKEFGSNPEYEKNSRSFQDSKEILEAIAGYMREYWVEKIYWFKWKNLKWSYEYWVDDSYVFNSYYSYLLLYFKRLIWLELDVWVSDTCLYHDKPCRYKWDFNWRDWDFTIYDCEDSSTKGGLYLNWSNE